MLNTDLKVRLGTPDDEDAMMQIALEAWEENGLTGINHDKMRGMIKPALYLWDGIVGIIGEKGSPIQAAILMRISQMWYSDEKYLEEKALFVHPEYRSNKIRQSGKAGHARVLSDFAKKTALSLDLPLLIGVLSNQRTEAKRRLYQKSFGEPSGYFFLFNGSTGQNI